MRKSRRLSLARSPAAQAPTSESLSIRPASSPTTSRSRITFSRRRSRSAAASACRRPASRSEPPMSDNDDEPLRAVGAAITAQRAKALLIALARVPSPLTDLMEAEPKLRAFIDTAVAPRLPEMGIADHQRDAMGNLLATLGRGDSGRSLMLVTNAMNQPPATMPNPYGGEVRDGTPYGLPGEVVLGKGLSEQKAPLAAILLALEALTQC